MEFGGLSIQMEFNLEMYVLSPPNRKEEDISSPRRNLSEILVDYNYTMNQ